MVDPVTTELIIVGVTEVAKRAEDFLTAALGHPGESIGEILGNTAHRRIENAQAVLGKSNLILLNIGLKTGEIPLNILQPAIEAASLQEDPTLQDIWANLLANAGDPRQSNSVMASFPAMLKELGGQEVKFLDALYENANAKLQGVWYFDAIAQMPYDMKELMDIYVSCGLTRSESLFLVTGDADGPSPDQKKDQGEFHLMLDVIRRQDLVRDVTYSDPNGVWTDTPANTPIRTQFHITMLGAAFVKACRPPSKKDL
jgi:hypothetical protein